MASGHSATASSTCSTGRPPAYSEEACVLRSLPACSTLASSVTARSPAVRLMTVSLGLGVSQTCKTVRSYRMLALLFHTRESTKDRPLVKK